jgi:hypothetical protein
MQLGSNLRFYSICTPGQSAPRESLVFGLFPVVWDYPVTLRAANHSQARAQSAEAARAVIHHGDAEERPRHIAPPESGPYTLQISPCLLRSSAGNPRARNALRGYPLFLHFFSTSKSVSAWATLVSAKFNPNEKTHMKTGTAAINRHPPPSAACKPPCGSCPTISVWNHPSEGASPSEPPRPNPLEAYGATEPPHSAMAPSALPSPHPPRNPPIDQPCQSKGAPIHPAECFLLTPSGSPGSRPTSLMRVVSHIRPRARARPRSPSTGSGPSPRRARDLEREPVETAKRSVQ